MKFDFDDTMKDASLFTVTKNQETADRLGLDIDNANCVEVDLARENVLLATDKLEIKNADGEIVWDIKAYDFLKQKKVPKTVNPSLWLNGKANSISGVFSIIGKDIIQVRGFDLANLTLVRGKTGWIVLDTMTVVEASSAAIDLAEKAIGEKIRENIRAVIVSHSHTDHFGGIRGVVDEANVGKASEGKIPIYVPVGFNEETVRENVYAGIAMRRRGRYQFGIRDIGEKGFVTVGLGLSGTRYGHSSFIKPTDYIDHDQMIEIDGLKVDFQLTLETEAPAEMNNYFRDYRALWVAENCCGTLHNVIPMRGAKVRDSSAWSKYLTDAVVRFADKSDVVFQAHNWPHFNTEKEPDAVKNYLLNNAAIYKCIHDQTLMYANKGYTSREIAQMVKIPDKLWNTNFYIRPYYGTVEFNSRAVYQKYLGFFNGNPADLNPLTETQAAKKLVEYIGSEEKIIEMAKNDYDKGEYRWVAQITNQLVFANPDNKEARYLCADAFEQLGYSSESGIWRNAYLAAATELRTGAGNAGQVLHANTDILVNLNSGFVLDYLGITLDIQKAEHEDIKAVFVFNDEEDKKYLIYIYNGILLCFEDYDKEEGIPVINVNVKLISALSDRKLDKFKDNLTSDEYAVLKNIEKYVTDLGENSNFNIVEP